MSAPATVPLIVTLSDAQLERLADLLADRLRAPDLPSAAHAEDSALMSAALLAGALGVSRAYVYEHADELGAVRLGEGPRARLRFDLEVARAALSCCGSERSQALAANGGGESVAPAPRRRRSLATGRPQLGSILPIRPRKGALS